jgi:hypothetical protein
LRRTVFLRHDPLEVIADEPVHGRSMIRGVFANAVENLVVNR